MLLCCSPIGYCPSAISVTSDVLALLSSLPAFGGAAKQLHRTSPLMVGNHPQSILCTQQLLQVPFPPSLPPSLPTSPLPPPSLLPTCSMKLFKIYLPPLSSLTSAATSSAGRAALLMALSSALQWHPPSSPSPSSASHCSCGTYGGGGGEHRGTEGTRIEREGKRRGEEGRGGERREVAR